MPDTVELQNLVVRLTGESSSYIQMWKNAEMHAETATRKIEALQKQMEQKAESTRGVIETSVRAMEALGGAEILKKAFEEFEGREANLIKLTAAIDSNKGSVEALLPVYKEFADMVAHNTMVGKSETMQLLATAEAMGVSGKAAQQAVQGAIGLSNVPGAAGSAEHMLRFTAALASGDAQKLEQSKHFLRMIPQLRGIKDDNELVAKATQLMGLGWDVAGKMAGTAEGALHHLHNEIKGLYGDLGQFVAEGVKPVIEWMTHLVKGLRDLPPETKKWIVVVAATTTALLALGPAISVVMIALGPVIAIFTTGIGIVSAFAGALGPVGVAVIAVGAYLVNWRDLTEDTIDFVQNKWESLVDYLTPAIEGIKDALEADDLTLGWKIAWTQIKLTVMETIQPLRVMWIDFTSMMVKTWFDAMAAIQKQMAGTGADLANIWTYLKYKAGSITFEEGQAEVAATAEQFGKEMKQIEAEHDNAMEATAAQWKQERDAAQADINRLREQRDGFVKEAREKVATIKPPKADKVDWPRPPTMEMKIMPKFDAVAFNSAEAVSKMQQQIDLIQSPLRAGQRDIGGVTASDIKSAEAEQRMNLQQQQVDQAKMTNDKLDKVVDGLKGAAVVQPAGIS